MKLRSLAAGMAGLAVTALSLAACSSDDTSQKTPTPPSATLQAASASGSTSPSPTAVPVAPASPTAIPVPTVIPAPIATVTTNPTAPRPVSPQAPANLSDLLQRIVLLNDAGRLAPTLAGISVQVDLPPTGGSSLSGTADGKLLVEVRVRAGQDVGAVRALGQVVSTAADQSTLTVAIEPARLRDLAGLPVVASARELIRPSTGADSRP